MKLVAYLTLFLPLIGSLIAAVSSWIVLFLNKKSYNFSTLSPLIPTDHFQKKIKKNFFYLIPIGAIWISFFLSLLLLFFFYQDKNLNLINVLIYKWFGLEKKSVFFSIQINQWSCLLIPFIMGISSIVHWYSLNYMKDDKTQSSNRYFVFLSLFTFFMIFLVCSDNWIQFLIGWEGVGLCSYFLINHWYTKTSTNISAQRAFITNRITDIALLGAVSICIFLSKSYSINDFISWFQQQGGISTIKIFQLNFPLNEFISILLLIAVMGKSAQIGFHFWLCEAMEGPTPVSALMHGATMVVAGIILILKTWPIFYSSNYVNTIMGVVSITTMFIGGIGACCQDNIKKILAYSTISQLGLMLFCCSIKYYSGALLHLITHGFFKALLFLAAGNIIHCFSSETNIKCMGGALLHSPKTFIFFVVAALSLMGIPGTSGFLSKEFIFFYIVKNQPQFIFIFILFCIITVIYISRMGYYIFLDTNHSNDAVGARLHEVPTGMITSLVPLLVANFALTQKMAIYIMSTMYPNSIKNYIYSYDQKYWSLLITTTIVFTLLLGILIFKKNKQNYFMKPFGLLYFLGKKDFFMDVFYQKIEKITIYILAKKIVSQNIEWKFIEKTITYGFFTIVSRSHHIFSFFYKNSIHYTLQAIVIMIWIFLSNTVIFFNF